MGEAGFSPAAGSPASGLLPPALAPRSVPPGLQTAGTGLGMATEEGEKHKHSFYSCDKSGVVCQYSKNTTAAAREDEKLNKECRVLRQGFCTNFCQQLFSASPGSTAGSLTGRTGHERVKSQCGGTAPADRLAACWGNHSYHRARFGWSYHWKAAWNLGAREFTIKEI